MRHSMVLALAISLGSFTIAQAEKNAQLAPKIASIGSVVVEETFSSSLPSVAKPVKGQWEVAGGVLTGKELASDKHAAVLNYQKKNRDSVVRFSFKLDRQTKGFNFSLNHARGHLFRVVIAPNKMTLNLDKDKKDPKSKAVVLSTAKGEFAQGKWYTIQIEMLRDRVVAQTDNGLIVDAKHAKLDTDKPNYRFVMRQETLTIDDLYIWDAS